MSSLLPIIDRSNLGMWIDAMVNGCVPSMCRGGCDKDPSGRVIDSLAGAVGPRGGGTGPGRIRTGPAGGLVVRWSSLVRVAGRRRKSPARRPRLARAGGPRARHRGQRACSLESSCPSLFVRSFVQYVTRPAVGSSWGTNCERCPAASGRRVHRGY